jgi:hypothetical protein
MFTKKVTDDDNFMALSSSAQALYLHLSMSADDDGFCNQISISMFKAHASVQDLQALLEKRYIYQFDNGVIVIKHWRMANSLRKDRYTPTAFQEELAKLDIKDNGSYTWLPSGCQVVAKRLPQVSKGKVSKEEVSLVEGSVVPDTTTATNEEDDEDILEWLEGPIGQEEDNGDLLECLYGPIGQGVIWITENQMASLLDILGIEGFDLYVKKVADFIIAKNANIHCHYDEILKWYREDTKVRV